MGDYPPTDLTLVNKQRSHDQPASGDSQSLDCQLEVVAEEGQQHSPSSSLSMSGLQRHPSKPRNSASCFVHSHFLNDRLSGEQRPDSAAKHMQYKVDKDGRGRDAGFTSRGLTKKQLSDMAFSIRELSQRLGHFRLKLDVKNVFLLMKAYDESLVALTRELAEWLLSEEESGGRYTIYVENTLEHKRNFDAEGLVKKHQSYKDRLKYWTNDLCREEPHKFDIILALGGDGTVLYASWLFQNVVPPVMSFALGSLGFLTKFDFGDFRHDLHEVLHRGLSVSLRLRLEATVMRSRRRDQDGEAQDLVHELIGDLAEDHHTHEPECTRDILNDLVIDRGPNPTMSSIEVLGDNFHITTVQADGICVSTPTGSTAYNLAAGGSLCHPDNPVILVTAICAHTLSFRPIILPDTVVLRLGVPHDGRASCWVSFDGKERVELGRGDYVTISASRFPFPTVLPLGRGGEEWVDSLSRTLSWNARKRQKGFK